MHKIDGRFRRTQWAHAAHPVPSRDPEDVAPVLVEVVESLSRALGRPIETQEANAELVRRGIGGLSNDQVRTRLESLARASEIHAEKLGLVPVTTPARSPQSNGTSEAFVNTLRRDYIESAELWSAQSVMEQIPEWLRDYNEVAPHSALGMKSPLEYRAEQTLTASP